MVTLIEKKKYRSVKEGRNDQFKEMTRKAQYQHSNLDGTNLISSTRLLCCFKLLNAPYYHDRKHLLVRAWQGNPRFTKQRGRSHSKLHFLYSLLCLPNRFHPSHLVSFLPLS